MCVFDDFLIKNRAEEIHKGRFLKKRLLLKLLQRICLSKPLCSANLSPLPSGFCCFD